MSERLVEALKDMKEARGRVYASFSSAYNFAAYAAAAYYGAYYTAIYSAPEKVKEATLELLCQRD